jgi:hypothetical protein
MITNAMYKEQQERYDEDAAQTQNFEIVTFNCLLHKNVNINIYRTIILPVVLHGCETWSLTFRQECRRRVFENRVLRRNLGPKGTR